MFNSLSQCGVQQRRADFGVGGLGDEAVHADQGGGQTADAEEGHAAGERSPSQWFSKTVVTPKSADCVPFVYFLGTPSPLKCAL